jgi:hypothetical protein
VNLVPPRLALDEDEAPHRHPAVEGRGLALAVVAVSGSGSGFDDLHCVFFRLKAAPMMAQ